MVAAFSGVDTGHFFHQIATVKQLEEFIHVIHLRLT